MMARFLVAVSLLIGLPALAADEYPGYGVVQSVKRLPPPEQSASAGSSSPSPGKLTQAYLVRVKMDDGSFQVRQVKRREVAVGQRVLVTNAGDVLPE